MDNQDTVTIEIPDTATQSPQVAPVIPTVVPNVVAAPTIQAPTIQGQVVPPIPVTPVSKPIIINAPVSQTNHEHNFELVDKNDKGIAYCKCGASKAKNPGGRPSKYTPELLEKARKYMDECLQPTNGGKIKIPYIEELSIVLDVNEDQIVNYAKEHDEFKEIYNKIKTIQKWRLTQRVVGGVNATGCIFLLKANHGMVESERQILAGDEDNKLEIVMVSERPIPGEETENVASYE